VRVGRVRTRRSFAALRQRGVRARHGELQVTYLPADGVSAAYAVGRSTGSAVVRNRVRRRLRAAIAELAPRPGTYLVTARAGAADLPYQDLREQLAAAIAEAHAKAGARMTGGQR
jgi:ribonuclease P protein component